MTLEFFKKERNLTQLNYTLNHVGEGILEDNHILGISKYNLSPVIF